MPWNRNVVSALSSGPRQPQVASCLSSLLVTELAGTGRQEKRRSGRGATSYGNDFIAHEVESDELGTFALLKMALGRIPYSRA